MMSILSREPCVCSCECVRACVRVCVRPMYLAYSFLSRCVLSLTPTMIFIVVYIVAYLSFVSHCYRLILSYLPQTRGMFKGMSFPLFAVGVINSAFFGVYGSTIQFLGVLRTTDPGTPPPPPSYLDMTLVGGFAGVVQSIPCTPIELVKVRLQVQRGNSLIVLAMQKD